MKYIGLLNSNEVIFFDNKVLYGVNGVYYSDIKRIIKNNNDYVFFSLIQCRIMVKLFKLAFDGYLNRQSLQIKIVPVCDINETMAKYFLYRKDILWDYTTMLVVNIL